jgi:hypothetical protein
MKQTFLIAILAALVILPSFAQEEDPLSEDVLFGSEDDLFGEESGEDGLLTIEADAKEEDTGELDFLIMEDTRIGGSFSYSSERSLPITDKTAPEDVEAQADLTTKLFLDARPDESFRFYLSGELSYPFEDVNNPEPAFTINEAFSDVIIHDKVYIRTGKQTLNWGVGYFYSPADIVSLGAIDPSDPEAELEGPVAIKTHLPIRSTNLYFVSIADDLFQGGEVALAPKIEFVWGKSEISLGGYYQHDQISAAMATVTFPFFDLEVFGEAVIQRGNSVKILQYNGPVLEAVDTPDTLYPFATAGFSYRYSDDDGFFDLFLAGQYYFNGQGYEDPDILQEPSLGLLLLNEDITAADLIEPGQHYLGASLVWTDFLGSDFTLSEFFQWNISDHSYLLDSKISFSDNKYITLSLGYRHSFGEADRQYTTLLADPEVYLQVSTGIGDF